MNFLSKITHASTYRQVPVDHKKAVIKISVQSPRLGYLVEKMRW